MTTCCSRLSKVYMILTNALFACLGLAFLAFGLMGLKSGFYGSSLFPANIFKWLAILGAIICVASLIGGLGAFVRKNLIMIIYMIVILAALALQVYIGIKFYKAHANLPAYLSDLWSSSSSSKRTSFQNEFSCCGFQTNMDKYASSDQCQPTSSTIQSLPSCADILTSYSKSAFGKAYLVIFAALALELLAMANAITALCTSFGSDDETERRRRRKSGIRLDDISVESPTTLVGSSYTLPEDQKKYYAGGSYNSYSANEVGSPVHDRNDMYNNGDYSHQYNTGNRANAYY